MRAQQLGLFNLCVPAAELDAQVDQVVSWTKRLSCSAAPFPFFAAAPLKNIVFPRPKKGPPFFSRVTEQLSCSANLCSENAGDPRSAACRASAGASSAGGGFRIRGGQAAAGGARGAHGHQAAEAQLWQTPSFCFCLVCVCVCGWVWVGGWVGVCVFLCVCFCPLCRASFFFCCFLLFFFFFESCPPSLVSEKALTWLWRGLDVCFACFR